MSVNSSGQVVGVALGTTLEASPMQPFFLWGGLTSFPARAFIWDKHNGMKDLGTLPGGTDAQALVINERGQVIGNSYTSSAPSALCFQSLTTGAFIWDKTHGMRDLGNLGDNDCTHVNDLNNGGQAVGASTRSRSSMRAFLWDEQHGMRDLGGSLGGDLTGAFVINQRGQSVGFAFLPGDTTFRATLWKTVGTMTDLGVLGNDQCSAATGINAKGQVVGLSITDCAAEQRAFLWENGTV